MQKLFVYSDRKLYINEFLKVKFKNYFRISPLKYFSEGSAAKKLSITLGVENS